jgi:hypothetical protein
VGLWGMDMDRQRALVYVVMDTGLRLILEFPR